MASNKKLTTKSSAKVQAVQEGMRRPVQNSCVRAGLWLVMKSSETPQHADQSSQLGSKTTPVSTMPNEELGVATSQSHLHWQLCAKQPAVAGLCQQQHQGRARSRHQPQPPALAGLCNTPAVAGLCQQQHQGRARSRHPPKSPAVAGLCKSKGNHAMHTKCADLRPKRKSRGSCEVFIFLTPAKAPNPWNWAPPWVATRYK